METDVRARVLHGNEACAEGALLAGCRFFAGYPITPATEIAEVMAQRLPLLGGVCIQMEDELASVASLIGASWGGQKPMTATSGPGFTLMQEGIGYANLTQTPCVVINVMRGGPATGQPTISAQQDVYQARYGCHGDYENIVLTPSSAQEALDLTIRAFNLAERYLTPVIVLSDEIVGHTRERVLIPAKAEVFERKPPPKGHAYNTFEPIAENRGVPYRAKFGDGHALLVDGQVHDIRGTRVGHLIEPSADCVNRILKKIRDNIEDISDYSAEFVDDADFLVVAYGSTARSAKRAVLDARSAGLGVGFIQLRTLFPFPEFLFKNLPSRVRKIIVPEMNAGKICREVQHAACMQVMSLPKLGGDLHTPGEIFQAVRGG